MSIKLITLNFNKGYELPTFKESRKGDWYEYGSERPYKNCYPDFLTKLYNESSKHATIINGKTNFIVGKGFDITGNVTFQERAILEGFLRHPNEDENMDDLLRKIVKDKKVYGGFCLQIMVNANRKIAGVSHINFANVRKSTLDEETYYYTENWKTRDPESNEDFTTLELFPYSDQINTNTNYIIYYKEYRPDLEIYPLGDYVSAVPYLEADSEIANFTLQNIKNNLTAGYMVSFNNGEPTPEEMADIERRFKDYATGTDNAGKPLLSFTDQNADHPQIIPIPVNGQDERFINLNNQIREEIFTAHGIVSPMMFGIKDMTGLGNNADELRTASELYQNLYIDPEQEVLNEVFNEIVAFNGLPKALKIVKIEPITEKLSEQTIISVMTQDEIREKIGLPPLEARERVSMDDETDKFIFDQLKDYGFKKSELEIIQEFNEPITCIEDAEMLEHNFLSNYSFALGRVLRESEKEVLDIIKGNPKMPVTEISKALNLEIEEVNEIIQILQDIDALDKDFLPTEDAETTIQVPQEEIFVVYEYALSPTLERRGEPELKDTSRPFCIQMIALGRMYTLDQLKMLRNGFGDTGMDIFTKRGGWYTVPGSSPAIHRPFCRHVWNQKVVRIKR
jgi:capsid portal protein